MGDSEPRVKTGMLRESRVKKAHQRTWADVPTFLHLSKTRVHYKIQTYINNLAMVT